MKKLLVIAALILTFLMLTRAVDKNHKVSETTPPSRRLTQKKLASAASQIPFSAVDPSDALSVAEKFIEDNRAVLQIQDHHELRPITFQNPLKTVIKYNVFQDGLPVIGIGFELEVGHDLELKKITNRYRPLGKADLDKKEAPLKLALKISPRFRIEEGDLRKVNAVLYAVPNAKKPVVAYIVKARDRLHKTQGLQQVIVRASDGQVIGRSRLRSEF